MTPILPLATYPIGAVPCGPREKLYDENPPQDYAKNFVHGRVSQSAKRAVQFLYLTCVILLCMSGVSSAQDNAESSFTLKQVGPNVWAAISNQKSKAAAGANTGFVIGNDGVVVIDTTASVDADGNFSDEPAKQLLGAIRTLTKLPVKFVINTH